MLSNRIRKLNKAERQPGPILYWMSRDQRVGHNWALIAAQQIALNDKQPLIVVFNLVPEFLHAQDRQFQFMYQGLRQVKTSLAQLNIPLVFTVGEPVSEITKLAAQLNIGAIITDFSPLRIGRSWRDKLASEIKVPVYEVDAHNIVPAWLASDHQEFAAYTIRPKLQAKLDQYLTAFEDVVAHPFDPSSQLQNQDLKLELPQQIADVKDTDAISGERAAQAQLQGFIANKLAGYAGNRNDPNLDSQSGLSPYLHFGQISAQHVATAVQQSDHGSAEDRQSFLEELIIRRELAENFCFYNSDYDNFNGFPNWAKATLTKHASDSREFTYNYAQFAAAGTHDPLWNAAQIEMLNTGKMHGYMRMYWAKKILEWTSDPAEAIQIAVKLNDTYHLDGRDPNGYAGCAWSIGGVHDRAWFERPIYGQIRYMNASGAAKKFDVPKYIATHTK